VYIVGHFSIATAVRESPIVLQNPVNNNNMNKIKLRLWLVDYKPTGAHSQPANIHKIDILDKMLDMYGSY
jgi:hypothetical protein